MYQHILFPIDGSADSRQALPKVQALALGFAARVTLVHSFHTNLGYVDLSPGRLDFVEQTFYAEAEALLQEMQAPLIQAGIQTQGLLARGEPADVILELVQSQACDLIVMGRQGTRSLKHLFMGSVSQYILNHAPCPVLLILHRN